MEILLIALFTFIASAVGTITSFGTATFMVPVLGIFYPLGITLLFTGIIHWFGNFWKILFFRSGIKWQIILLFGIPGIIASYLGAQLVPDLPEKLLARLLGIFLILYVIFIFKNKYWKLPTTKFGATLGGIASGFSAGIFGVGGAIRAAFLSAYNLKKEVFIFTAGAIGIFIDSGRIAKYLLDEIFLSENLWITLAVCIPVSFIGSYTGKKITEKIPQSKFRNTIAVALLVIAVKYILWP